MRDRTRSVLSSGPIAQKESVKHGSADFAFARKGAFYFAGGLRSANRGLRSAICDLRSAVCDLRPFSANRVFSWPLTASGWQLRKLLGPVLLQMPQRTLEKIVTQKGY